MKVCTHIDGFTLRVCTYTEDGFAHRAMVYTHIEGVTQPVFVHTEGVIYSVNYFVSYFKNTLKESKTSI